MSEELTLLSVADPCPPDRAVPEVTLEAVYARAERGPAVEELAPVGWARRRAGVIVPAVVLAAVLVAAVALAGWRRSDSTTAAGGGGRRLTLVEVEEALAAAPPDQAAILADGVVTEAELQRAAEATKACFRFIGEPEPSIHPNDDGMVMVDAATGPSGNPARMGQTLETMPGSPVNSVDLSMACQLRHLTWVAWGWERTHSDEPDAIVFLDPETSPEDVAAVQTALGALDGSERTTVVSRDEAFAEFRKLFANSPEMLASVDALGMPPSVRLWLIPGSASSSTPLQDVAAAALGSKTAVRGVIWPGTPPWRLQSSPYPDEFVVPSDSMQPGFRAGQIVKTAPVGRLARGDLVIVSWPAMNRTKRLLRVIGLPGDRVRTEGGRAFVNGQLLEEPYLGDPTPGAASTAEVQLTAGQYWLMGDNRADARDSRVDGPIDVAAIVAAVAP